MALGKFIVIDGVDSSGKKTHARLLKEWLESKKYIVSKIAFPQYDKPFGAMVGKYLKGEYGSKEELSIEVAALIYTMDRYHFAPELQAMLARGEWVIADRYNSANLAHQAAKYANRIEQKRLIKWLDSVESRMPQPDIVIILKQNVKITRELHEQRRLEAYMGDLKLDIHDADLKYQQRAMDIFLRIARQRSNWFVVDCINKSKLRPIEDIQADVRKVIEEQLELS